MTRRIRFDWSLDIVTLTELHVGTGETRLPTADESQKGIEGEVATIVRDNRRQPWIPGPTLKGALRQGLHDPATDDLLGRPHSETSAGDRPAVLASAVTVFGACRASDAAFVPIVRPRTAVSGGTGASEANKLFAEEWVPTGTTFKARFRLEVRRRDPWGDAHPAETDEALEARADRLRAAFEARLARFCLPDGVAIAADKSDGMGRIRFDLPTPDATGQGSATAVGGPVVSIPCSKAVFGPNGWEPRPELQTPVQLPAPAQPLHAITLDCPGPYIARGGVREEGQGDKKRQITTAERSPNGKPRMHPSGVAGALRKRAEWLAALAPGKWPTKVCRTSAGDRPLTVVQRLFGHEGRRGSVNIDVADVDRKGRATLPFVPLDPVTQAPVDTGPFSFDADYGVTAALRLGLFRALDADEAELLGLLAKEVSTNGLFLGGASSKGWGWFNDTPTQPTRAGRPASGRTLQTSLASRLPDKRITLPYRMIQADPSQALMPETAVADRIAAGTLLSDPIPEGVCGWLDVSWCVDTPILIGNGGDPVSPQMLGKLPVLPGSTLRGLVRNVLDSVTQARFSKLNGKTLDAPVGRAIQRAGGLATHDGFRPDFVQALFGHVVEPETAGQQQARATHQAHHLKSRLAFGYATLQTDPDGLIDAQSRTMQLLSPNPKATFYDAPGRKAYFATGGAASEIEARLNAHLKRKVTPPPGKKVTTTDLKFLHPPSDSEPLVFRGRIRFHNVTLAELGALIWGVTFGFRPFLAHRIGHARAYGAGRGYADDLRLHVIANTGATPDAATEAEFNDFGLQGHSTVPAREAFRAMLEASGLSAHQSLQEVLAAADPKIGSAIRKAAGLGDNALGYQISEDFSGDSARDQTRRDILAAQGNRMAAMLKPKPPA